MSKFFLGKWRAATVALLSAVFLSTAFGASNTVLGKTSNIYDSITGKWTGVIDGNGNEQIIGNSSGAINGAISLSSFPGAIGDCINDDTAAWQLALNAAAANHTSVAVPPPKVGGCWKITSTLNIVGTQVFMGIAASGVYNDVRWLGGNNTSMFRIAGLKNSIISGLKVHVPIAAGIIVWDIDTQSTIPSTSNIAFEGDEVDLGVGNNNVGFRLGHNSAGGGDVSYIKWDTVSVYSENASATGTRGWLDEGSNTFILNWNNSIGAFLEKMVTNFSDAGAASGSGGSAWTLIGCGGTSNRLDFEITASGAYVINGGRWETGNVWINTYFSAPVLTVTGVMIDSYNNGSSAIFNINTPGIFVFDNIRIGAPTPANSSMFNLRGGGIGSIVFRGGAIQASDPFYSTDSTYGLDQLQLQNVAILGGNQLASGFFKNNAGNVRPNSLGIAVTDGSSTPGNVTQNVTRGRAAFAISGSSVVVTDSLVTAASQILLTLQGNDSTCKSATATPAAGSFTVRCNAAATAATTFDYTVIQP